MDWKVYKVIQKEERVNNKCGKAIRKDSKISASLEK